MGNSPSSSKRQSATARELEKFIQPTGLYPSCPWDPKVVRRLVVERKIAPRFPGREAVDGAFDKECPICFMYYPGNLNVSSCCKKPICSECYLQMRPPHKPISCPFCNGDGFAVGYSPPSSLEVASIFSSKRTNSRATSSAIDIPSHTTTNSDGDAPTAVQYASVEDRQRLRESLRSQLSITDRPITDSPHPNSLASLRDAAQFLSTPADAARLEELMVMEAIRRSMRDLNAGKESEDSPDDSSSPRSPSTPRVRGLMERGAARLDSDSSNMSDADYGDDVRSVLAAELFRSESSGVRYAPSRPESSQSSSVGRGSAGASDPRSSLSDWNPFDD